MKILYVEDNPANVFLVKRVARMGNHEIINYIDGDKALEKYSEIEPDLILMDIQLAGNKSGLDVVKSLRGKGVKTPIIAVTAYAMVGDKERCIEAGCDDYLAKPLPIQRLVEMFKQYSEAADKSKDASPATPEKAPEPASEVAEKTDTTTPEETEADSTVSSVKAETPEVAIPEKTETTTANKATTESTETPAAEVAEAKEKDTSENPAEVEKNSTIDSINSEKVAPVSESKPETELSSVVESTPVVSTTSSDSPETKDNTGE